MTTTPAEQNERLDGPIHGWFGLTYSNYLVLHRSMMQSMPVDWQERAVALFDELDGAFTNLDRAPAYIVTPAEEREYGELTQAEYNDLGIGHSAAVSTVREAGDVYYDRDGNDHQPSDPVLVPIGADPIPHYNRGRTFIEATP